MEQKELQEAFNTAKNEILAAVIETQKAFTQELDEKSKKGFADPETIERVDRLFSRLDGLDAKLGAPGGNAFTDKNQKSTADGVLEDPKFLEWKERGFTGDHYQRLKVPGNTFFGGPNDGKSNITTGGLGSGTSGVIMPQRIDGLVQLQKQRLMIRDLLPVFKLPQGNRVDWLKQNVFTNSASPQTEASAKAESTITYTTASSAVSTIAHFVNVSRQALDDVPMLRADIDNMLDYGLKLVEEAQILLGDGLGDHLNGIATQASAYNQSNASGDTKLDILRHYILQARLALYPVDGVVLNPRDLAAIDLLKTEEGGANKGLYIVGNPRTGEQQMMLWGKPVVESDSIPSGKCLVGAFGLGARLYDRMQSVIDISLEHASNFTSNLATIRAEERLALAVLRPGSFVYGAI